MPKFGSWEVRAPDKSVFAECLSERHAQHFAKFKSTKEPGRWTAQKRGSEGTFTAGSQYRYVYQGGEVVAKGDTSISRWLGKALCDDLQP